MSGGLTSRMTSSNIVTSSHPTTFRGTIAGVSAVGCWTTVAAFMSASKGVHPLLYAGIEYFLGAILLFALTRVRGEKIRPAIAGIPSWFLILGSLLFTLQAVAAVAAFQFAPPLEALMFHYQWPMLVVVFTSIALGKKLHGHHYVAVAFGLSGLLVTLLGRGLDLASFSYAPGLLWAIVSSCTWSLYSALAARQSNVNMTSLGVFFLVGSVICLALWAVILGTPLAEGRLMAIATLGGFVSMLGYVLWDYGMRTGNTQMIGITSFLIPILSSFVLVISGQGRFTPLLLLALGLVMIGISIAKYGDSILNSNK